MRTPRVLCVVCEIYIHGHSNTYTHTHTHTFYLCPSLVGWSVGWISGVGGRQAGRHADLSRNKRPAIKSNIRCATIERFLWPNRLHIHARFCGRCAFVRRIAQIRSGSWAHKHRKTHTHIAQRTRAQRSNDRDENSRECSMRAMWLVVDAWGGLMVREGLSLSRLDSLT